LSQKPNKGKNKKHKKRKELPPKLEQKVDQYEDRLRQTYRRESDLETIKRKLFQFQETLYEREVEEDNRDEASIRIEEHELINHTMIFSMVSMAILLIACLVFQDKVDDFAAMVGGGIKTYLSWFYMLLSFLFLVFLVYLAFTRYGNVVLGDPASEPEFSNTSWYAMLFSAGMGVGLMFYGGSEPFIHYLQPPEGDPASVDSLKMAFALSAFNWGLSAWGIYTLCALGVAYFGFRRRKKYLMSSSTIDLFQGKRSRYAWKVFTDTVSTLAIVFGIGTSLGMGVLQMATGLEHCYGLAAKSGWGYAGILLAMTICFLASATTGLDKGIKILSNFNMILALALLLFVFVLGPSIKILDTFVESLGFYLSNIVNLSLSTGAAEAQTKAYVGDWPVTILAWTIAWAPFVGVFIARISRGRTLREVILGSLIMPTVLCMFWFATFGGSVLELHFANPELGLDKLVLDDKTSALFVLLESLPLTGITEFLSILLIFVFLVTSADSATFVVAMMTTEGDLDPGLKIKMVWGLIIATITFILLNSGGLQALQAASLVFALPFSIVLIGVMLSLYVRLSHQISSRRV